MRALVAAVVLSSCTGVHLGGDYFGGTSTLTRDQLDRSIEVALRLGLETSDPRLHVGVEALDGFSVYTRETHVFDLRALQVTGWTNCASRTIVVGTPPSGWAESSLVHEVFHAMQGCSTPGQIDVTCDKDHANWSRDGLFPAIIKARTELKGI